MGKYPKAEEYERRVEEYYAKTRATMRQFHDRGTKVTLGGNPPKPTQEEQREIWARDAEAKKSNSNSKIIGIVVLIIVLFNLIKMIF